MVVQPIIIIINIYSSGNGITDRFTVAQQWIPVAVEWLNYGSAVARHWFCSGFAAIFNKAIIISEALPLTSNKSLIESRSRGLAFNKSLIDGQSLRSDWRQGLR